MKNKILKIIFLAIVNVSLKNKKSIPPFQKAPFEKVPAT
jgi:hypothetical protein